MKIRMATLEDLDAIMFCAKSLASETERYFNLGVNLDKASSHIKVLINNQDSGVVFVAEIQGNIVGGFVGGLYSDWMTDSKIAFDYVNYVSPDFRNHGIGKSLINEFIDWAKQNGAAIVQCGTLTGINSEGTKQMYESVGMSEQGVFMEIKL